MGRIKDKLIKKILNTNMVKELKKHLPPNPTKKDIMDLITKLQEEKRMEKEKQDE